MNKLWPGQAQYMTILIFILPLWPWPWTYLKKGFKWQFSCSGTTTVQNYFWNSCINVPIMARTSSIYDHLTFIWPLWPWPSTYLKKGFKWLFSFSRTTTVQNYFWNSCINVQVMAQKSSIYDHFDLYLTPVTLTFNLSEKNVSNGTSPPQGQLCKIILKSINKCTSHGPDKLNIWPFWPLLDPCDLDLQPIWKMFQMALFLLKDNNCAKLFLKFMHKCTSYGPDKLIIWPFWPLFDPCDLDLQPTWKNVSNDTSPPRGQKLCKIILKSMDKCTSYAPDKLDICIR